MHFLYLYAHDFFLSKGQSLSSKLLKSETFTVHELLLAITFYCCTNICEELQYLERLQYAITNTQLIPNERALVPTIVSSRTS